MGNEAKCSTLQLCIWFDAKSFIVNGTHCNSFIDPVASLKPISRITLTGKLKIMAF